jgi:hypothetical protein
MADRVLANALGGVFDFASPRTTGRVRHEAPAHHRWPMASALLEDAALSSLLIEPAAAAH